MFDLPKLRTALVRGRKEIAVPHVFGLNDPEPQLIRLLQNFPKPFSK